MIIWHINVYFATYLQGEMLDNNADTKFILNDNTKARDEYWTRCVCLTDINGSKKLRSHISIQFMQT